MLVAALALAAAPLPPALQPLQFLVGHCWRTTLKEGPTDTHCFSSLADGTIRDRHAVRKDGQVIYTGESTFSAQSGQVRYRYDGSTGAHVEGPMHVADAKIIFDDTDKTGSETLWRQLDASHYEDVTIAGPDAPPELALQPAQAVRAGARRAALA
jgi:hypothetical protein